MRIYWRNTALNLEPESQSEQEALEILLKNVNFGRSPKESFGSGVGSAVVEKIVHNFVRDEQAFPSRPDCRS